MASALSIILTLLQVPATQRNDHCNRGTQSLPCRCEVGSMEDCNEKKTVSALAVRQLQQLHSGRIHLTR